MTEKVKKKGRTLATPTDSESSVTIRTITSPVIPSQRNDRNNSGSVSRNSKGKGLKDDILCLSREWTNSPVHVKIAYINI